MTSKRRGIVVIAILIAAPIVNWWGISSVRAAKAQERVPGFLAGDGKAHDSGPCGWNGDLDEPTGRCTVRIVFPAVYAPVTCIVKKKLPEQGHEIEQVVECTWKPR